MAINCILCGKEIKRDSDIGGFFCGTYPCIICKTCLEKTLDEPKENK